MSINMSLAQLSGAFGAARAEAGNAAWRKTELTYFVKPCLFVRDFLAVVPAKKAGRGAIESQFPDKDSNRAIHPGGRGGCIFSDAVGRRFQVTFATF
jgi:hypothetical protein